MRITLIISIVVSIVIAEKAARYPFRYPHFHVDSYGSDPYGDERVGLIHDFTQDTTKEADPTIWDIDPNFHVEQQPRKISTENYYSEVIGSKKPWVIAFVKKARS
jgi:hypothetical protein